MRIELPVLAAGLIQVEQAAYVDMSSMSIWVDKGKYFPCKSSDQHWQFLDLCSVN